MTGSVWTKTYKDPARRRAAECHLHWLAGLNSGVRLPDLHASDSHHLVFEHLDGRPPGPSDLGETASTLGQLHAAAYRRELHRAHLDQPHRARDLVITDFISPRRNAIDADLVRLLEGQRAAIYKDANLRNFLLTPTGVVVVDFDELTLAPFGYDLAKLIVTTAMTYGPLPQKAITAALDAYNQHTAHLGTGTACPTDRLLLFAEVHHQLTVPYLGRHGYRYAWPSVRPTAARMQ